MTEATNHSYVDGMLDGRTGTPEVRFQQAAVTGRCCGVRVRSKEYERGRRRAGQGRRRLIQEGMIEMGPGGRRESRGKCKQEGGGGA